MAATEFRHTHFNTNDDSSSIVRVQILFFYHRLLSLLTPARTLHPRSSPADWNRAGSYDRAIILALQLH